MELKEIIMIIKKTYKILLNMQKTIDQELLEIAQNLYHSQNFQNVS